VERASSHPAPAAIALCIHIELCGYITLTPFISTAITGRLPRKRTGTMRGGVAGGNGPLRWEAENAGVVGAREETCPPSKLRNQRETAGVE